MTAVDGATTPGRVEKAELADGAPVNKRPRPPRRLFPTACASLVGAVLGFVIGRIVPPPYPDESWWGAFLVSPGFGGALAVVGALVAAAIAWHNSRSDRRQKQAADDRDQWWSRFTWAGENAVSANPAQSVMGLSVLVTLIDTPMATDDDREMAIGLAQAIDTTDPAANSRAAADTGGRCRHKLGRRQTRPEKEVKK